MLLHGLRETRLKNGLTLLLLEDRSVPVFTLMLWVPVGSRDERPGITGVSHYLEHCYSLGSARFGPREVDRIVQSLGGQKNAFTSTDYTAYYESLPSGALPRILEVEADRFAALALPADRLASELDVVCEERRLRTDNSPAGRLHELLLATAFERHSYRHPIIGTAEDLKRLCRDDVLAWYRTHYAPSNVAFVLVGDFDAAEATRLFEERLGGLPPGERPAAVIDPEPAQTAERRVEACMASLKLPRLAVLWKVPGVDHGDTTALEVLSTVLFDGDAARLDRILRRERRLVASVGGGHWESKDPGPFTLEAEAMPGVSAEAIVRAVDEALADVRDRGVTAAELRRAQAQLELTFMAGLESTSARARAIGRAHVTSARGVRSLEEYPARVRAVTLDDVRRVAATYLRDEARTIATLLPPGTASAPAAAAPGGATKAADEPLGLAWGEARRWEAPGGPVVLYLRTAKLPTVAIAVQSRGGSAEDPPGKAGLATLALDCLRTGTTSLDEDAIAARFGDLGASLGGARGADSASIGTTVLARDFEEAVALLADVARRPAFAEEKVERAKDELLAEKASAASRPDELLIDGFYRALYAGHPYEAPINGTVETIPGLTRADLAAFHATHWRPRALTIAIVGDVAPERVRAAILRHFTEGAEAAPATPAPARATPPAPPASRPRIVVIDKPDQSQAHIRAGLPSIGRGDHDHDALALASVVLGSGGLASRIPDIVRTKNGLAYSAGSALIQRALPAPFVVSAQTQLSTAARALELMLAEVTRMRTEPVADDELARAKSLFAGALPFRTETNAQKAGVLLEAELFALGPDHLRRQIERVKALTAEDLRAVFARRVDAAGMSIVVVGPRILMEAALARFAAAPPPETPA